MSARDEILKNLDRRIQAHRESVKLREESIENFALKFFLEMEQIGATIGTFKNKISEDIMNKAFYRVETQIRYKFDKGAEVSIVQDEEERYIRGILVKWSPQYILEKGVDPEIFISPDILLFK
jgi:hypothetical protein